MSGLDDAITQVLEQEARTDELWAILERERPTLVPSAEYYESYVELSRKGGE